MTYSPEKFGAIFVALRVAHNYRLLRRALSALDTISLSKKIREWTRI